MDIDLPSSTIASVGRLYFAYFDRIPDFDGLNYWLQQHFAGMSLDEISARFYDSEEFRDLYGDPSDAEYVDALYQNIFHREGDAGGVSYWNAQLADGKPRERVLLEMSDSAEFRSHTNQYFDTVYQRDDGWSFNPIPLAVPEHDVTIRTLLLDMDFDHRTVGAYSQDDLLADVGDHSRAVNIFGDAEIIDIDGDKKLQVTLSAGEFKNGLQFYKTLSDDYPVVHFSYEIKFSEGFDWQLGGKMPGLGGKPADAPDSYNPTGGNPVGPDEGFSARGSFREDGTADGYIYHQDKPGQYGEYIDFDVLGHDVPLPTGRTLFIEQTVQMNTPGKADGVIQTWINGVEVSNLENMTLSESGDYGVNQLFFDIWHGGSDLSYAPDQDSIVIIDNIQVSIDPFYLD